MQQTTKTIFNNIILSNLILKDGYKAFGYPILVGSNIINHTNYYSLKAFSEFVTEMENGYPDAYKSYKNGSGSELLHKDSNPPKMASVASSSRFCYLALKDSTAALGCTNKAIFETRCPIKGVKNATANLDACITDANTYTYIEAKCQEIFDTHEFKMRIPYWDCIYGTNNDISFNLLTTQTKPVDTGKNYFDIPMDAFGLKDIHRFDFKQFLCHLLGIAHVNKRNKTKGSNAEATLCYMFFKPLSDNQEINLTINDTFKTLRKEIKAVFESNPIQEFCKMNNIKLKAIAEHSKTMRPLNSENIEHLYP